MKQYFTNVFLLALILLCGCAIQEEAAETREDTMPPSLYCQGMYSETWEEAAVNHDLYQDVSILEQVGIISESVENRTRLTQEFSTNLEPVFDVGAPVYLAEIDGKMWLVVDEGHDPQLGDCQYLFYNSQWIFH